MKRHLSTIAYRTAPGPRPALQSRPDVVVRYIASQCPTTDVSDTSSNVDRTSRFSESKTVPLYARGTRTIADVRSRPPTIAGARSSRGSHGSAYYSTSSRLLNIDGAESTNEASVWRQTTHRLIEETEVGKFDSKLWQEAHQAIIWWLNQSPSSNHLAVDGCVSSFHLLDRMLQEEQHILNTSSPTDGSSSIPSSNIWKTDLLNLVMNQWRKLMASESMASSGTVQYTGESRLLYEQGFGPSDVFERILKYRSTSRYLQPDVKTISMIIDATASARSNHQPQHGAPLASQIVKWAVDEATKSADEEFGHPVHPNVFTFASAINSWAKSSSREGSEQVSGLLQQMRDLHGTNPTWDVMPNYITYCAAIDCWSKDGKVEQVEEALNEMYDRCQEEELADLKPDLKVFNGYLAALAKRGKTERIEEVLQQMHDFYELGEISSQPDVVSYSIVIDCFVKSPDPSRAAQKAESILDQMIRRGVNPNTITFNTVIHAHAKAGNYKRVEQLLKMMHTLYMQGNEDVKPTIQSYSVVLVAISKSRDRHAVTRALAILDAMKELAASGELDRAPDLFSYNLVLDCFKSSPRPMVDEAKAFLKIMRAEGIEPDMYSYNMVLHVMAQEGRFQDCHALIRTMPSHDVLPDTTTYNTLLSAYAHSISPATAQRAAQILASMENSTSVKPDTVSYNTVLNCHKKLGNGEAAEKLLETLLQTSSQVQPDKTSFNTAIAAWSRSQLPEAAYRAERLYHLMKDFSPATQPDTVSFNTLLFAWSRSRDSLAGPRCENLLKQAESMYESGESSVQLDTFSYGTMLLTWSWSKHPETPENVERLFREFQERCTAQGAGNGKLRVNSKCYGALINAWAFSTRPGAAIRAEEYLDTMIQIGKEGKHDCRADLIHFRTALQAWAGSSDPDSVDGLESVFRKMQDYRKTVRRDLVPDVRFFGTILKDIANNDTINDKEEKADQIVDMMKELRIRPNRFADEQIRACFGEADDGGDNDGTSMHEVGKELSSLS